MRPLDIFYDGPPAFAPRAAWCLDTMLAPLGRRGRLVREREAATGCALAYAAAPVPGVPTVPLSSEALELFEAARPLPRDAYRELQPSSPPCDEAGRSSATPSAVPGAFPAAPGFAVPFDLVASAFALLACWDEHTSRERDRFDRLPFSASVFGANRYLRHRAAGGRRLRPSAPGGAGAAPRGARRGRPCRPWDGSGARRASRWP